MNPMTPDQLITLFKTFIQDPRFEPVELGSFKDTIAVLEEYSEIKPQYEAEVARLQKERDEAVEAGKKDKARLDWIEKIEVEDVQIQVLYISRNDLFSDSPYYKMGWMYRTIPNITNQEIKHSQIFDTHREAVDAAMEAEK